MNFNFSFKSSSTSSSPRSLIFRLLLLCTAVLTLVCAWWPAALHTIHIMTDAVQHGGGFMYLLEFGVMLGAVLVTAFVSGVLLFSALAPRARSKTASADQRANSAERSSHTVRIAERLNALGDDKARNDELRKLRASDESTHRAVVGLLQQWRAEAKRQAVLADTSKLKLSSPRWVMLAEEQAALIRELRASSSPGKATATDATWLTLPEQRKLLDSLSRLMGTNDFSVIMHNALRLLFVAYRPGVRFLSLPVTFKPEHPCEKAMACLDALMVMPEAEKLNACELRDVVRWWKYCADLACTHRVPGVVAPPDSLEWVDTALVLPLTPADPDVTTTVASSSPAMASPQAAAPAGSTFN